MKTCYFKKNNIRFWYRMVPNYYFFMINFKNYICKKFHKKIFHIAVRSQY